MSTNARPGRFLALPGVLTVLTVLLMVPGEASAAPPVADSGPDVTVVAGTDAQLQGSVSDPDGDALEIHWMATVVDQGDESSCTFSGPWSPFQPATPAGLAPTLNCTAPGKYLLQLVVADGTSSDDDTGALITFTHPDTTPATCSLEPWLKGSAKLRITDAQSDVESFTVLDTYNLTVKPMSGTWYPPTTMATLLWSRPGRGAGMMLVTHENAAGVNGECVLFVRRNGTASVLN
jgi:hypothetical protein